MEDPSEDISPLPPAEAAVKSLLSQFVGFSPPDPAAPLCRPEAIRLLETVLEALSPHLDQPICMLETGETVVARHVVSERLRELIDALHDLDKSKVHPALKPAGTAKGASLSRWDREQDRVLLDAVLILQHHKGLRTTKAAEGKLERILARAKRKRKGKRITQKALANLRSHANK